jgi:hypothetical protein
MKIPHISRGSGKWQGSCLFIHFEQTFSEEFWGEVSSLLVGRELTDSGVHMRLTGFKKEECLLGWWQGDWLSQALKQPQLKESGVTASVSREPFRVHMF